MLTVFDRDWSDSRHGSYRPFVSIVVCTTSRRTTLMRCLDSLRMVRYDGYEVVVVDNSPVRPAEIPSYSDIKLRSVWEGRPGSGFARAAGVAHSRGKIIAMTDDDCVVDPSWLRWLVDGLLEEGALCCTGRVVPFELVTPAQVLMETFCSYSKGDDRKIIGGPDQPEAYLYPQEVGTGANMAFWRDAFDRVGPFDGALGAGTIAAGGEELDMFSRILAAGGKIAYEPRALVKHDHIQDYATLRRTFFRYGVGYNAFMTKLFFDKDKRAVAKACLERTLYWFGMTKHSLKCRWLGRAHMPLDLQFAYLAGSLLGPPCWLRSTRRTRRMGRVRTLLLPESD